MSAAAAPRSLLERLTRPGWAADVQKCGRQFDAEEYTRMTRDKAASGGCRTFPFLTRVNNQAQHTSIYGTNQATNLYPKAKHNQHTRSKPKETRFPVSLFGNTGSQKPQGAGVGIAEVMPSSCLWPACLGEFEVSDSLGSSCIITVYYFLRTRTLKKEARVRAKFSIAGLLSQHLLIKKAWNVAWTRSYIGAIIYIQKSARGILFMFYRDDIPSEPEIPENGPVLDEKCLFVRVLALSRATGQIYLKKGGVTDI
ncbi:hypothetical protein B0H14DRAFT_2632771 [Mycena olivaceomarginata]|nr:hypothetical protein B0H14DRAFT_2632771 [Mycena olivaceomarginata]